MKRRKLLSILVCLALVMTIIPAAAFADASPADTSAEQSPASPSTNAQAENPVVPTDETETTPPASEPLEPTEPAVKKDVPSVESTGEPETSSEAETESQPIEPSNKSIEETMPTTVESQSLPAAKAQTATSETNNAIKAKTKKEGSVVVAKVTNTAAGIKISGGTEGKDWTYDPRKQTLTIMKDGVTISGTATDDLAILCTLAVTAITMDRLNSNGHLVALMSADENGGKLTDLTIQLKGKNKIDLIVGVGNVSLAGTKNSRLDLSIGAVALNDLNIKDADVSSGIFAALRDINISGKSRVTAKATKYTKEVMEMGILPAMMIAGRDINVDLAPGGRITAQGTKVKDGFLFDQVYPMMAGRHINISERSKAAVPNGGKVETSNLLGMLNVQIVKDASATPAINPLNKKGSGVVQTFAAGSPQTGDTDTVLGFLYLLLLMAGIVLLVSRRKRSVSA